LLFNKDIQFYQGFDGTNNTTLQNIQPSNVQFSNGPSLYPNPTNGTAINDNSQLQDTKIINKPIDNLNNLNNNSTSVNINGTVPDTNSNTLNGVVANNANGIQQPTTVKPKRKERPSTKPKPFKCPTCQQTFSRSHGNYYYYYFYYFNCNSNV